MGAVAPVRAQHAAGFAGGRLSTRARAVRASVARRVVAKAVAEASVAQANKAEWNSLGSVCAVLGSQWGDEGKGKLVDILAQVRFFASIARCGQERVVNRSDATNGVPSRRARVPTAPRAPERITIPVAIFLRRLSPPAHPDRGPLPSLAKRVGGDGNLSWLRSSRQRDDETPKLERRFDRVPSDPPRSAHPSLSPIPPPDVTRRSTTSSRAARAAPTPATPSTTTRARSTPFTSSPLASSTRSARASSATASSSTSPACSRSSMPSRRRV